MALNFPIPTSVGQVYQDPISGNTYVCTSLGPPAQWVGSGSSTSLDNTYLRKDASNDPVTGNLLLNPTTNVSPLTLQQPVGNTTPALKIENSGSGNSIEANGFAVSETGVLTLGTALAIASGGTGATTQSAARTNLGATTVGNAVFTAVDEAAARTAIGSPAFAGDATATITTNSVVRSQIDSSGNVSSTIPGGSTLLPEFKCRAWVNFNGSTTPPTIRGSGNILSVTRRNTGRYTVTFSSDFPDTNYCAVASGSVGGPDDNNRSVSAVPNTTSSAYVVSWADNDTSYQNLQQIHVSFYR